MTDKEERLREWVEKFKQEWCCCDDRDNCEWCCMSKSVLAALDVRPYDAGGAVSTMAIHQETMRDAIVSAMFSAVFPEDK